MITKKRKREELQLLSDEALEAYLNREDFQYDLNGDALYRQYKDRYTDLGKKAMQDTMGQAAALTGGYGSSYAQNVGQQAYQGYLDQLGDVIPALYQLAYDRYQDQGKKLYNTYQSWAQLEQQAAQQEQWEREYELEERKLKQQNQNSQTQAGTTQPDYGYHQNSGQHTQSQETAIKTMQRVLGLEETGKWTEQDRIGAGNRSADDAWKDYQQGKLQNYKSAGLGLSIGNIKTMERVLGLEEDGYWDEEDKKAAGGLSEYAAWKDYQQGKLQSRSKSGMSVDAWSEWKKKQPQSSGAVNTKQTTPAVQTFIAGTVTEDQAAERGVNSTEWKMMVKDRLNRENMTMEEFEQLEKYYGLDIPGGSSAMSQGNTANNAAQKMSYAEYRKKTAAQKVDDLNAGVQRFFRVYQAFANSAIYDLQNVGYQNAESMLKNRKGTSKELRKTAEILASALRMNGDIIAGDCSELIAQLVSIQKGIDSIMDAFDDGVEYYSRWDTEEEYKLCMMSSDEVAAERDAKAADDDDIAYTTKDGQNITWKMLYDQKFADEDLANRLATYSKNPDWEEKSKGIDVNSDPDRKNDYGLVFWLSRMNVAYEKEYALADGLSEEEWNEIDQARRYIGDKYGVDLYADPYDNAHIFNELLKMLDDKSWESGELSTQLSENLFTERTFKNMRHLTDDEKAVLNYIFYTQGRDAALQWHNSRMHIYQNRANGVLTEEMSNWGKEDPIWSSAGSVALSLGSGLEQIGDWLSGDLNNTMARASSAIRSGVSENTDWMIGNWDAFDFVYNTGMSGVDSLAASLLPGGAGSVLLGLSAAAQATNDALDRGMSQKQAFWNGLAAGIFEGIFEKWSIGNFKGLKEVASTYAKDIAKNIAKSMLVNASEETLTEIANIAYDSIVNGDFSQYETKIRQYVLNGMTEAEAKKKTALDLGGQVVESGVSGALMGFGFGTTGSASAVVQNASNKVKSNQALQAQGYAQSADTAPQIVAEVLNQNPDNAQAQKLKAQLDSGKGLSTGDLQTLQTLKEESVAGNAKAQKNTANQYATVNQANTVATQAEVAESLKGKGILSRKIDSLASAIVARVNGQELTRTQRDVLRFELGRPSVQKVINELIQKKSQGIDSVQKSVYDESNLSSLKKGEETALRNSSSLEVLSTAQQRGRTSETAALGDTSVAEDSPIHQERNAPPKRRSRGGKDAKKPYSTSRPSYGKGQIEQVWENAKDPITGKVYDPSGVEITWDPTKPRNGQWDMGHIPDAKYSVMHQLYMDDLMSLKDFLEWYRNPANYRPELPSTNRSHKYE